MIAVMETTYSKAISMLNFIGSSKQSGLFAGFKKGQRVFADPAYCPML
jgi:hypothetical protein